MSIVEEIYRAKNYKIADIDLAAEILKHDKLGIIDLWLLPQYPFDQWRRKYDYPRILQNIKSRQSDFTKWMDSQGILDEHLLQGYFSDFFQNKPLSKDKIQYLIRVSYKGETNLQVWHKYNGEKESEGDGEPVLYEFVKSFISYYDWRKDKFNFTYTFESHEPNTENEQVYLNKNISLLKMGGIRPPTNGLGALLRGKKLEFVNVSGLVLRGNIFFADFGNLSFDHCAVDNLICNELDMPLLHLEYSSVKNVQIKNSNIQQWMFINCKTTGNIIDSKLFLIAIYGGQFNPTFTNSEIDKIDVKHKEFIHDSSFEKTYRTLSKSAKEAGNKELSKKLKISEYNFIKDKTRGIKKWLMTLDKIYWDYGQNPKRLIYVTLITIFAFGLFFSFFPEHFSDSSLHNKSYAKILFNTQYYSAVTFSTLGYGDISPRGFLKLFAGFEAIFGAITLGFLVAGLTKND